VITYSQNSSPLVQLPYVSPKSVVKQVVGLTEITIEYNRPNVRGRKIWGDIVPYDKVWRTGANQATTLNFSDDVWLNGNPVKAGKYALYTIPTKNEWTILLNKNAESWGIENYKEEDNVLAFRVKPLKDEYDETFTVEISNIEKTRADIFIEWEKVAIAIEVRVDVEQKVLQNISTAISNAKDTDWEVFATCADYALKNNLFKEEVPLWIDKAMNGNPKSFRPYWLKADLAALNGKFQVAIDLAKQALQLGFIERGEKFIYKPDLERAIALWETKL
jgi:hypothetical protein